MNDRLWGNNPDCAAPEITTWIEANEDRLRLVNDILNQWDELCADFEKAYPGLEFIPINELKENVYAQRYAHAAGTRQAQAHYGTPGCTASGGSADLDCQLGIDTLRPASGSGGVPVAEHARRDEAPGQGEGEGTSDSHDTGNHDL